MTKISAIVMAAGMSKRMMADKLHLKIKDKYIYEYILQTIKGYNFFEIIVVAKDEEILRKAKHMGYLAIRNPRYYLGQSESIKEALINSKETNGFMFFVADQPFIKIESIKKLCSEFQCNSSSIVLPHYNGIKGNPVIFPYHLKKQLLLLREDQGGKIVINNNKDKVIRVDIETEYENLDIDTVDDYEKAKKILDYK
ncbi:NTP transferase domain-containing protein [Paramaledivibacter caminithermalis]|jgi:molybdenum cofactor cytidylyltransferase|uniref:Molybdenum cofactor cytidylyltransferase n=1 Tax=Paramaledivibacter caminithermalis (strain DSM 15212 / CIP 107654 / DViRD3) TaxID=1121301 RepID=A0A1M6K8U3_PARC5|nr:NTP transferase domain-containing protein [Paramaledivibacter caminithermalis]SHJ55277.1 molybdenum cofactor cytidylyltransferase [Paramaledivibacter caminithermalis DSM 15212]